jgi:hypothetical protein
MPLEELFNEVRHRDVKELACIDNVLSYYEELDEEAEEYMEVIMELNSIKFG